MIEPYYVWEVTNAQLKDDWNLICKYWASIVGIDAPRRWVVDRAKNIYDEIQFRLKWVDGGIDNFDFGSSLSETQKELLTLVQEYDKLVAWNKSDVLTNFAWTIIEIVQAMSSNFAKEEGIPQGFPFLHTSYEIDKTSKREDVNPEAGKKKYGDVAFADSTNNKYPIDTEVHIRAAWNYINKSNNVADYSTEDVTGIKNKIVAAWKKIIDPKGPKSAQKMATKDGKQICKLDDEKRILYAVVLEPDVPDSDGQTFTKEFISESCHSSNAEVFKNHQEAVNGKIVENFIAPVDITYETTGEVAKAGSWIVGIKVNDDELWKKIKAGDFTGVSVRGAMSKDDG